MPCHNNRLSFSLGFADIIQPHTLPLSSGLCSSDGSSDASVVSTSDTCDVLRDGCVLQLPQLMPRDTCCFPFPSTLRCCAVSSCCTCGLKGFVYAASRKAVPIEAAVEILSHWENRFCRARTSCRATFPPSLSVPAGNGRCHGACARAAIAAQTTAVTGAISLV